MWELIKFEIHKLLHKPLIWASLLGLLFFAGLMIYNWVAPGYSSVQEDIDGYKVVQEGHDAVLRNQEIVKQYQGALTTDKVQDILEAYSFSQAMMESENMEPERQRHYTHNCLCDTFSPFANLNGSYNGKSIRDVYGEIAPDLIIGYSVGWEKMLYALAYSFLVWGCVLVIILSPVFSEEYTKGTDALILTGSQGQKKCPGAKIIASYAISLGGSVIFICIFFLSLLAYHGPEGFEASVQLGELGFFTDTPYVLTWGEAFGFACLLWLGATIVLTAMALLISALAKNSFSALVIVFVLFVVPLFIRWTDFPAVLRLIGSLLPINQMQLQGLFSFDRLALGSGEVNLMWLVVPISVIALSISALLSKKSFANHQVV